MNGKQSKAIFTAAHSYSRPLYFGDTAIPVRIVSKSY